MRAHLVPAGDAGRLLAAWRDPTARPLDAAELAALRVLLAGPLALHRRGWRNAIVDPAAAVGLGIELLALDRVSGPAADLVFSALLAHARDGDRAAALVLGRALARRVAGARRPHGRSA